MGNLTVTQRKVLREFAAAHGTQWRSKLRRLWTTGKDENVTDGAVLRQIRNSGVNIAKVDVKTVDE